MQLTIDEKYLLETTQRLVRINSVNPKLVEGAPGEKDIAKFLEQAFADMNLKADVYKFDQDRYNVVATIKGSGGGRSLMLNAHTDTVGVQNMSDPFSGRISDGKLFGRGSFDMKGSIASIMTAAKTIVENKINLIGDLVIALVADEEYQSIGTEELLKKHKTDAAIVTEPTGLEICIAHKGFGLFELVTKGKAAHGGKPDEGIDANINMGLVLAELNKEKEKLAGLLPHKLLGLPSLHVPLMNGGSEPFTYADHCRILLERRVIPGETINRILTEIDKIFRQLEKNNTNFKASVKELIWRDPFENNKDSEIVQSLFNSAKKVIGSEPNYIGHSWWEDSGLIGKAGIDTVIFGPKGEGLHTENEWVDIQSLNKLSSTLVDTAINYCG